jgi:ribosome-binding factor A
MTPDLQHARVYFTTLGNNDQREQSRQALERATPFLRRQIGQRLTLKRTPALTFHFDESIEHQERVEQLLEELQISPGTHTGENDEEDQEHDE